MITACSFAGISAFFWCFECTQHNPWAWSRAPLPPAAEWQPSVSLWAELQVLKNLVSLVMYFCFPSVTLIHHNKAPRSLENYCLLWLQLLLPWIWESSFLLLTLKPHHEMLHFLQTQAAVPGCAYTLSICLNPTAWINLQTVTANPLNPSFERFS